VVSKVGLTVLALMAKYYSNQEPDWEIILVNVYNWNSFYNWLIVLNIAEILLAELSNGSLININITG